jgi:hypothetical protein
MILIIIINAVIFFYIYAQDVIYKLKAKGFEFTHQGDFRTFFCINIFYSTCQYV